MYFFSCRATSASEYAMTALNWACPPPTRTFVRVRKYTHTRRCTQRFGHGCDAHAGQNALITPPSFQLCCWLDKPNNLRFQNNVIMPTARPASKPLTKSSGHCGTFHAGSTQCKRHVGDDLSSVRPMKTQTAPCSQAPGPAPQTNCIWTSQTLYESNLQRKTRLGTLQRRLRPGQRRLGVASEIRARSWVVR